MSSQLNSEVQDEEKRFIGGGKIHRRRGSIALCIKNGIWNNIIGKLGKLHVLSDGYRSVW